MSTPSRDVCVVIAIDEGTAHLQSCLESIRAHTPTAVAIERTPASVNAINEALTGRTSADVLVVLTPCEVSDGWIERLATAAHSDSNTATASALADRGTPLALEAGDTPSAEVLAASVARHTLSLHPRLSLAVGPCVYLRREALELVGALDETLEPGPAVEIDFAQRCILSGLANVAADDVAVRLLATSAPTTLPPALRERYPYLLGSYPTAASPVLPRALSAARGPMERLSVTIDARALDGAITGTQVHILELILALARTEELALRLLIREARIGRETLELLRELPATELLSEDRIDEQTPRSTVLHRPQQAFAAEDIEIATRLGERIVLNQLDLIAYRNPGYFPDGKAWEAYRRASRRGMSGAELVVVFSEHTRRELLSDELVEDERIRIVPPGLDHRAASAPRVPAQLEAELAPATGEDIDPFLLCLGTDFRHKNRLFALRLLSELRSRHGWEGRLVLAGTHIPYGSSRELEQTLLGEHPELRKAVIELGAVDEQEKAWLMRNTAAVLYPSVYEGFGLVPFEAALSGVPCLFAPTSSLADAAPMGTATLVPWDAVSSAEAAYTLLSDPGARGRHIEALAAAARDLTWERSAAALVEIYREAAVAPLRGSTVLSRDTVQSERELTAAHEVVVARLIGERIHAQRMYDELNAEVGSGLSLIGPNGALPDGLQRALLAINARPGLARPLFGALGRVFIIGRTLARALSSSRSSPR